VAQLAFNESNFTKKRNRLRNRMCFHSLNESLGGKLRLPQCTTDGTHELPTVLLFLAVGVARAPRVSHTCETALAAGQLVPK
tara:strand:+ start:2469 stop:2714 length:246 start_codon:yes stop_codon:yes gene_type:complete